MSAGSDQRTLMLMSRSLLILVENQTRKVGFTLCPLYLAHSPAAVIVTALMANGSNNCFPIAEENPEAQSVPDIERLTGIKWKIKQWHACSGSSMQNRNRQKTHNVCNALNQQMKSET